MTRITFNAEETFCLLFAVTSMVAFYMLLTGSICQQKIGWEAFNTKGAGTRLKKRSLFYHYIWGIAFVLKYFKTEKYQQYKLVGVAKG